MKNSNRLTLLLLLAVFAVPLLLAWYLYSQDYQPSLDVGGELYSPPRPMPDQLTLTTTDGEQINLADGQKWVMLQQVGQNCSDACLHELRLLQALHLRLQKNAYRVRHLLLTVQTTPVHGLPPDAPSVVHTEQAMLFEQWLGSSGEAEGLWLMDPNGYAVLSYRRPIEPALVLSDLKTLLKGSH